MLQRERRRDSWSVIPRLLPRTSCSCVDPLLLEVTVIAGAAEEAGGGSARIVRLTPDARAMALPAAEAHLVGARCQVGRACGEEIFRFGRRSGPW